MADTPSILDIAKFNLNAYETAMELQIKAMEVYGEFNLKMMEAAEKQVKIASDQVRLAMLQEAFLSYRLAQRESLRRAFALQQKLERIQTALRRLSHFAFGEAMSPQMVGLAWRGFWYITSQAPVSAVVAMSSVQCGSDSRKGENFANLHAPHAKVPSAPAKIKSALTLLDWARDQQLVVRLDSPASKLVAELLKILGAAAVELANSSEAKWKGARDELTRIREIGWKSLDVTSTPAKKP